MIRMLLRDVASSQITLGFLVFNIIISIGNILLDIGHGITVIFLFLTDDQIINKSTAYDKIYLITLLHCNIYLSSKTLM